MLRMSLRVDVEDEGVKTGDWFASLDEPTGDAVPSFASLFFLEDLLESLFRESLIEGRPRVSTCLGSLEGKRRKGKLEKQAGMLGHLRLSG